VSALDTSLTLMVVALAMDAPRIGRPRAADLPGK
jgi:hypothetical protein